MSEFQISLGEDLMAWSFNLQPLMVRVDILKIQKFIYFSYIKDKKV